MFYLKTFTWNANIQNKTLKIIYQFVAPYDELLQLGKSVSFPFNGSI